MDLRAVDREENAFQHGLTTTQITTFFRQLGAITRAVHDVRGPHFGRVSGTPYPSWSGAVIASFTQIADDLEQAALDATDVRKAAQLATQRHRLNKPEAVRESYAKLAELLTQLS